MERKKKTLAKVIQVARACPVELTIQNNVQIEYKFSLTWKKKRSISKEGKKRCHIWCASCHRSHQVRTRIE